MITVKSQPSGILFSSVIPDLSFSISGIYAIVTVSVDGSQLLSETYYADSTGLITLRDLSSMLTPYALVSGAVTVAFKIDEYSTTDGVTSVSQSSTISATVIYANADVQTTAQNFLDNHFLSILLGSKQTAVGRIEYIYAYGSSSVLVTAKYFSETGGISSATYTVAGTGRNNFFAFDVSSAQFVVSGKTLLSYTAAAGSRSQTFVIDQLCPDCAPILLFTNSFGCQELLYCTGTHQIAPDYNRSSTYQDGMLVDYDIEETRLFKANTGILTTTMANWADDLFRSKAIYLFVDGAPSKRIVITEQKAERSNDIDALPSFTFSYRYAQRQHNVLQLSHPGRIFDNTFDRTFN